MGCSGSLLASKGAWSPYFSRVVKDLEGKGEREMEERQKLVRSLVKAVVHCDVTQDPPIAGGYDRDYDVVVSSLCAESVAQTRLGAWAIRLQLCSETAQRCWTRWG